MLEGLVLNPVEFTPELPEISLEALGLSIAADPGPDFGEASETVERIRQDISEGVTDSRKPPVDCTIPLIVKGEVDLAIADPLHRLEGWVADVQRRKQGWVRRDFSTAGGFSGSVAAFVDSAALTPAQGWSFVHQQVATGIALKFTRYPIWFATVEVTEDAEGHPLEAKGVGVRDLQLELADLLGTAPGLITVRLKNEGTEDWRGCYVSLECDSFSSAATAEPKYEAAQLTPKGGSVISAAAAPEVRAVGTVAAGVASISPGLPAGTATGDLLIMVAESGGAATSGEANTPLTAAGWIEQASEKNGNTRLTVLSRIAQAANATATNDTGDHQLARVIGIKAGTFDPNAPFNSVSKGTQAATKAVYTGNGSTTRPKCLLVACASGNLPDTTTAAEFSGETSIDLGAITERIDNTTAEGDGGALFAATAIFPTYTTYAGVSVTAVTAAERAVISLAVNPIAEVVECPPLTAGWVTVLESPIGGTEHMTHVGARRMIFRIDDPSAKTDVLRREEWVAAGSEGSPPASQQVQWKLEWRTLGAAGWNQTMVTSTPLVVSSPVVGGYQLLDLGEARPELPIVGDPRFQWRLLACVPPAGPQGSLQPLIRDVYPMSTEQWARVADASESTIDGEPSKAPGTVEDATGVGTVAWSNPEKAKVEDESCAVAESAETKISHFLKATNFGFAIPVGASIRSIEARYRRKTSGVVKDAHVRIVKGGAIQATVDRSGAKIWSNTFRIDTFGGSADLWGQTWAVSDINSSGFGIALSAEVLHTLTVTSVAEVDLVTLVVAYSEGGNENRVCFASRSMQFADLGISRQHVTDEAWGDVPAPEGMLLKAPAPGQAGQDARLLVIPTVGDLAARPDSASVKAAASVGYRPGYLFSRESIK